MDLVKNCAGTQYLMGEDPPPITNTVWTEEKTLWWVMELGGGE